MPNSIQNTLLIAILKKKKKFTQPRTQVPQKLFWDSFAQHPDRGLLGVAEVSAHPGGTHNRTTLAL